MPEETRYDVCCLRCGRVWQPAVRTSLWWQAKQHSDQGYIDAIHVSGQKCGCIPEVVMPEATYRVKGFDDLCEDFDIPFMSLTKAAKQYLELARDYSYTVFFVDTREKNGKRTRVHARLDELV